MIHIRTKLGQTAYTIAGDFGKKDVAAFLARKGRAKTPPISIITKQESLRTDKVARLQQEVLDIQQKIRKKTDVALKRFLDAAGVHGNLDIVKECYENGINVEAKKSNQWRALHLACCYGHLRIVQYLIEECQASVKARIGDGSNALHIASQYGHLNIVRYLIEDGQVSVATKTNDGWTALHLASGKGQLAVVRYFVQDSTLMFSQQRTNMERPLCTAHV
jgi:ankyrin repeat protein